MYCSTLLNHEHMPQAQRVTGRTAPGGLDLAAAVGYACTLFLRRHPLADLPSGERVNAFTDDEKVNYRYEQDPACEQHYARSSP